MIKIGDFSQLTRVTVKTLHHYDAIGLLKPAVVDPFTGYRYYAVHQMAQVHRILALKDLGLSLDQISVLLSEELPAAVIQRMLQVKAAELESRIAQEHVQLTRVKARLAQIAREGKQPRHEIVLKQVEAIQVLAARAVVPSAAELGAFFNRAMAVFTQHRALGVGPLLAIYHTDEYREVDLDVEAAIPLRAGTKVTNDVHSFQVRLRELPGGTFATLICTMAQRDDVVTANQALCSWIEAHGYQIAATPYREVYIEQPAPGAPLVFEMQLPIEASTSPRLPSLHPDP